MDNHSTENSEDTVIDNAGGGLRGLRAQPSAQLFEAVRDSYGINGLEDSIDLGGSSSLNLLVTDAHNRYVVRVYRPYVTEARLADVQLARNEVRANGVPTSELIRTLDGQQWIIFDHRLVEVERYVESDLVMDSWELLLAGLPLLGRIHTILRGMQFSIDGKNPLFANYIAPEKALATTLQGTQRIRGWPPSSYNQRLADAADELAHLVSDHEKEFITMLPRQVVHGDYWDNNVFFRDGRIVLVTDFDFMGERTRIDDLALILYYCCIGGNYGDSAAVTDELLRKLRNLIDAYNEGLDERLSMEERLALPLAIARQPLSGIGGWVALLDDERAAKRHAQGMLGEVEWALDIPRNLDRWRAAFA
ncbi:phosphotransferase [Alicyclobacillus fodiniaquatilis]|uniref:Phosphotransferase n=1 Tax=Alicyclobacillus fodiniaquatilis TaxID=1661150 RepID=A0ABW4JJS5_9BACL